jgi:hypothetical protein
MPSTLFCDFCRAMRWVELKGGEYCEEGLVVAKVILNRMT